MTKNQILAIVFGTLSVGIISCSGDKGMKKTSDGLMYKLVKDEPGDKHPQIGDMVKMHVRIRIGDSVMVNSREMNANEPFEFPYMEGTHKSDWLSGLALLTAGDSAIFYVPVDSAKKHAQGQFPPWAKSEDTVVYEVNLVSFQSIKEMEDNQSKTDEEQLQAYFKEKNISPEKTSNGLYYLIDKEGTGPVIGPDKKVTVNYTGTNLQGKPFDSNVDPQFQHTEPFSFVTGDGAQVIPGWNEGIQLLKKGSKARFFIPSRLAYGPQDMGPGMGKNAVLVFDVEVLNVEDAPKEEVMLQ